MEKGLYASRIGKDGSSLVCKLAKVMVSCLLNSLSTASWCLSPASSRRCCSLRDPNGIRDWRRRWLPHFFFLRRSGVMNQGVLVVRNLITLDQWRGKTVNKLFKWNKLQGSNQLTSFILERPEKFTESSYKILKLCRTIWNDTFRDQTTLTIRSRSALCLVAAILVMVLYLQH